MRHPTLRGWAAVVGVVVAGCHHRVRQTDFGALATTVASPPPGNNWSLPPEIAERLFARAPGELVALKHTPSGVAGAFKAEVVFPEDGRHVDVKWKEAPHGDMNGWNNNPRRELAAYVVQKWFLEPEDYVVPTTALRCVPIERYRRVVPAAKPTLAGTQCVLGELTLWLLHVTMPETLYDPRRFETDFDYAYHLSNFNVLTYLIAHRDGRASNFLVADDEANRRVFSIDNGISFGSLIYNFLVANWDVIRVPAIRRAVVERLRTLRREDIDELGILVELRADEEGILRPVAPGPNMDPDHGVRLAPGRVQMGLTRAELDALAHRIATLIHRVDGGELAVF
jgi:hypothetical protein